MDRLGEFGFWLALAIILTAWIVTGALKERDKARQKQEMIRALLTAEGRNTTEILAYLRERDAAEQKREHDVWVATNMAGRKLLAILAALAAGILAFFVSVRAINAAGDQAQYWPGGLVLLGPIAAGGVAAFLVYLMIRGKKNVPPPGA